MLKSSSEKKEAHNIEEFYYQNFIRKKEFVRKAEILERYK